MTVLLLSRGPVISLSNLDFCQYSTSLNITHLNFFVSMVLSQDRPLLNNIRFKKSYSFKVILTKHKTIETP